MKFAEKMSLIEKTKPVTITEEKKIPCLSNESSSAVTWTANCIKFYKNILDEQEAEKKIKFGKSSVIDCNFEHNTCDYLWTLRSVASPHEGCSFFFISKFVVSTGKEVE